MTFFRSHAHPLAALTLCLIIAAGSAEAQTWRHLSPPDTATFTEFDRVSLKAADGTVTREVVFRIRTETIHIPPRVDDAVNAYRSCRPGEGPSARRIRAALGSPVEDVSFDETPLRDVVLSLGREFAIPIRIELRALDDAGLDPDEPVSKNISGTTLRSALGTILTDLDLTHAVRHEMLVITTRDDAEENKVVAEYPTPLTEDIGTLITLIQQTVAPTTWNTVGGTGVVQPDSFGTRLVVSQTEEVHDEISSLLQGFREQVSPSSDNSSKAEAETGGIGLRVYAIPDNTIREYLAEQIVPMSNDALGPHGDAEARATVVGDRLVVQSSHATFQCYAAQVVRAIVGLQVSTVETVDVTPNLFPGVPGGGGGPF